MKEIWKRIPLYEGYEASNTGHVRSVSRRCFFEGGRSRWSKGRVLKPGKSAGGKYLKVNIRKDESDKKACVDVHRLVCMAFHGLPISSYHVVAHKDGNGTNNSSTNLRWATQKENLADCVGHGTRLRGFTHPKATIDEKLWSVIARLLEDGCSHSEISRRTGVGRSSVTRIANGQQRIEP